MTFACAVSAADCAEIVADLASAQAVLVGSGVQALDSFCFAVCRALFAFDSAVWFCDCCCWWSWAAPLSSVCFSCAACWAACAVASAVLLLAAAAAAASYAFCALATEAFAAESFFWSAAS